MTLHGQEKTNVITKFRTHETDTGSAEVQVALITKRIEEMNRHFEIHKKDHSSRRGLLKLVGQRRKLLGYLKEYDEGRYLKLIAELGIRK